MIEGLRVLAIVPARGGSKGIPGKNLAEVGGVPMLDLAVRCAQGSRHVDEVAVTSDDDAILARARALPGVTVVHRPAELASDDVAMAPVVAHAVSMCAPCDVVVLLQPTSPLREPGDVDGALELLASRGADSVVSVAPVATSPWWMYVVGDNGGMSPVLPKSDAATRQALPDVVAVNGAVYAVRTARFLAAPAFVDSGTLAYPMPRERSIDVDTPADLAVARALATGRPVASGDS
ncbi:MAG: acylneuraminate cytidylyltransferase family protein [Actinobacteria bacterium]|nr:acylneuraminate cytidylyltransferase family protein [Actinomycetota bacterium]